VEPEAEGATRSAPATQTSWTNCTRNESRLAGLCGFQPETNNRRPPLETGPSFSADGEGREDSPEHRRHVPPHRAPPEFGAGLPNAKPKKGYTPRHGRTSRPQRDSFVRSPSSPIKQRRHERGRRSDRYTQSAQRPAKTRGATSGCRGDRPRHQDRRLDSANRHRVADQEE